MWIKGKKLRPEMIERRNSTRRANIAKRAAPTPASSAERFWAGVTKTTECWTWKRAINSSGYGKFWYNGKEISTHRFSWLLAYGQIPQGMLVLHKCDNPPCVNPAHLYIGTNQDNADDREERNRGVRSPGELSPTAKLTIDQAREIHRSSEPAAVLARRFGISLTQAWRIKNGQRWQAVL